MAESARDIARKLPDNPGCYLMKNKEGTVIYVGKAKNLKRRVNSYFLPNRNAKTSALVEKIANIDYVITGNEYEALILENNLIKKYTPHYNILLKDGKSYIFMQNFSAHDVAIRPEILGEKIIIGEGNTIRPYGTIVIER